MMKVVRPDPLLDSGGPRVFLNVMIMTGYRSRPFVILKEELGDRIEQFSTGMVKEF